MFSKLFFANISNFKGKGNVFYLRDVNFKWLELPSDHISTSYGSLNGVNSVDHVHLRSRHTKDEISSLENRYVLYSFYSSFYLVYIICR